MWESYFFSRSRLFSHLVWNSPAKAWQIISSTRNDTCTEYQIWLSCENETETSVLLFPHSFSTYCVCNCVSLSLSLSHTIVFHLTVTFDIDSHKWHATLASLSPFFLSLTCLCYHRLQTGEPCEHLHPSGHRTNVTCVQMNKWMQKQTFIWGRNNWYFLSSRSTSIHKHTHTLTHESS